MLNKCKKNKINRNQCI